MSTVVSDSITDKIWSLLFDKLVWRIGLCGIGGVGKTFILKQVNNRLANSPHDFDIVIWVTASKDLSLEKLQDDIWKRIGALNGKWIEKSFDEKAKAIHNVLTKKKFVLVLDDLWEKLDLTELGVPYPGPKREGKMESKLLLTSRQKKVCDEMRVQEIINVRSLNMEFAWELFKEKLGDGRILTDPKIHKLARLITLKCGGLPILLCTVGRAMARRTTYHEWKDALKEVRIPYLLEEYQYCVANCLKFCFHSLPNDRIRSCFLYYSFFPEDFTILKNELIDFWICEKLLGLDDTNGNVLDSGYNDLDALIDACLLEEEEENYVKLQDLIHDQGLSAAVELQMFKHAQLLEVAGYNKLNTVGWISSVVNSIRDPTNIPPELSTFFLNHNPFIMIKGELSQFMYALTVLDLSNSGVEEIPRWISVLASLQYLNLSYTWIERLLIELKMLTKLKCLNLEHNIQLRVIPKQLIYGLPLLQILKTFRCGYSVEELEDNILSVRNMDIDPLLCLKHLRVLSITITCGYALCQFFSNPKLLSCTQSLSLEVFWGSKSIDISPLAAMKNLLRLDIHQAEDLEEFTCNLHHLELSTEKSFARLHEINLGKCSSLQELTWVVLVPNLTVLRVMCCAQMKALINMERWDGLFNGGEDPELFAKLEILALESLPELKSIHLKALPFPCLKRIKIIDCWQLKKLPLNSDSARGNEVVIEAGEDWWKHVEWEDDATRTIFLPSFKPLLD